MHQRNIKIGILGGTFNPVHNGHLIVAETVREVCGLDRVILMPSGQPPHKPDREVADPECRYEMVRRAVSSNPAFEASRLEIDMKGTTYTVNTLHALKNLYGNDTMLHFIIGADVIPELTTWKDYRTVFGLCSFIAVRRPGIGKRATVETINRLKTEYGIRIELADAPLVDISSSGIRDKCSRNRSIKYLVPEPVEEYIKSEGLYGITER